MNSIALHQWTAPGAPPVLPPEGTTEDTTNKGTTKEHYQASDNESQPLKPS